VNRRFETLYKVTTKGRDLILFCDVVFYMALLLSLKLIAIANAVSVLCCFVLVATRIRSASWGPRYNVITPEQKGNYHKVLCDSALGYCLVGSNAQYVESALCIGVSAR
jgi:hypothetical protein